MRALVIVPAYNEAESLPGVIAALRAHVPSYDICVIDDGSEDNTAAVAAAHGVVVLKNPINLGIGGAVQTGYLWAREHEYDVAIQIDGDGQHDPAFLPTVVAPIEAGDADIVIGSRFLEDGDGFRSTFMRRLGIRYLRMLLALRCGVRVTDPTSGFRAAGRRAIALFAATYPPDYPEPESIGVAVKSGLRVREVPVRMAARAHGVSSIRLFGSIYYMVKVSMAIALLPSPSLPRSQS